MKTSIYRRIRHRVPTHETDHSNKDKQQEQSFFGESSHDPFFKKANGMVAVQTAQLKTFGSINEAVQINRVEDKKEEDKKVQMKSEVEKDKIQKKKLNPEEEEKIQIKEEENKIDRQKDDKEEEKIQKKADDPEEKEKIQKKEEEDEKVMKKEEENDDKSDKTNLQRKESTTSSTATSANYIKSLNGKGKPLPVDTNAFFSSRFGYNFSDVKVHTGKEAAGSAKTLNAKAYTIGNDIVFNEGQLNTDTTEGKKLMAHELTHVVQQNSENKLRRKAIPEETKKEKVSVPTFFERGIIEQNTRHKANCNGVNVEGHTDANYGHSYTAPGESTPVSDCPDCSSDECVVNSGTVVSVFTTNPQITLPSVPSGLNECEHNAVQRFIDTTLRAHERQHVAAFNTYRGRVRTPYTYRGCAGGLDAYLQQIHDRIEAARKANSDAASAALDAGGANIFTVNCDCPDPESGSSDE